MCALMSASRCCVHTHRWSERIPLTKILRPSRSCTRAAISLLSPADTISALSTGPVVASITASASAGTLDRRCVADVVLQKNGVGQVDGSTHRARLHPHGASVYGLSSLRPGRVQVINVFNDSSPSFGSSSLAWMRVCVISTITAVMGSPTSVLAVVLQWCHRRFLDNLGHRPAHLAGGRWQRADSRHIPGAKHQGIGETTELRHSGRRRCPEHRAPVPPVRHGGSGRAGLGIGAYR